MLVAQDNPIGVLLLFYFFNLIVFTDETNILRKSMQLF